MVFPTSLVRFLPEFFDGLLAGDTTREPKFLANSLVTSNDSIVVPGNEEIAHGDLPCKCDELLSSWTWWEDARVFVGRPAVNACPPTIAKATHCVIVKCLSSPGTRYRAHASTSQRLIGGSAKAAEPVSVSTTSSSILYLPPSMPPCLSTAICLPFFGKLNRRTHTSIWEPQHARYFPFCDIY